MPSIPLGGRGGGAAATSALSDGIAGCVFTSPAKLDGFPTQKETYDCLKPAKPYTLANEIRSELPSV